MGKDNRIFVVIFTAFFILSAVNTVNLNAESNIPNLITQIDGDKVFNQTPLLLPGAEIKLNLSIIAPATAINTVMRIELPGRGRPIREIIIKKEFIEVYSENTYKWVGKVVNNPTSLITINVTAEDGAVTGNIFVNGENYNFKTQL